MLKPERPIAILFNEIHEGSQPAFDELFLNYYNKLSAFAQQYIKQRERAEEITSELFVKLWLKRTDLAHIVNPEVYLYVSIKNASLNQLRSISKYNMHSVDDKESMPSQNTDHIEWGMERKELTLKLNEAVEALPQQRKIIFKLVKENGLKSREVAQILGISTRTVENQMYKAVKALADIITPYLGYNPQKTRFRKQMMSLLIFF
jgi:RNA polymerase sigma-70 factor (ECF subfamily)